MNRPTHIIVHCSDSPWGDAAIIDQWHRTERGFSGIGYHFVVLNGFRSYAQIKDGERWPQDDGRVERGRKEHEVGAHCLGYNDHSIGICLIGRGDYTERQLEAARELVRRLQAQYAIQDECVLGHCETKQAGGKPCPLLDMPAFRASLHPAV